MTSRRLLAALLPGLLGPAGLLLLVACYSPCGAVAQESPAPAERARLPRYAKLFAKVEDLEGQGELEAALRGLPPIYASEVPVTAFYETLARKKRALLEALLARESAPPLRFFYEHYLTRPDTLRSAVRVDEDLPPERFYYFQVVAGSVGDRRELVTSEDEWLVAAALFMARKGELAIDATAVLERWQTRPDLWDAVCTEQALLYLATLPREEIARLDVENEGVAGELERLAAPEPDWATIHGRMFWSRHGEPDMDLETEPLMATMRLERDGVRTILDLAGLEDGLLRLPAGSYRLHHVAGSAAGKTSYAGTYGASSFFGAEPGTFVRLFVPIVAGI